MFCPLQFDDYFLFGNLENGGGLKLHNSRGMEELRENW